MRTHTRAREMAVRTLGTREDQHSHTGNGGRTHPKLFELGQWRQFFGCRLGNLVVPDVQRRQLFLQEGGRGGGGVSKPR